MAGGLADEYRLSLGATKFYTGERRALIRVSGKDLTAEDVVKVARRGVRVELDPEIMPLLQRSRSVVDRIVESGTPAYGLNTGFGLLCDTAIPLEEVFQLQRNLVRSHAVGVGKPVRDDVARATMLLRLNSLCRGYSGVRPQVVELLRDMLNHGIHPIIPSQGSLGASGDLAPLAHLTLAMLGEGEVTSGGEKMEAMQALERAGLTPLTLEAKEGLALLNGTSLLTAMGVLTWWDASSLLVVANGAAAFSLEAMEGISDAFSQELMEARAHPGMVHVARQLRRLLKERSHRRNSAGKIQDAYSFRCVPQIHGAMWDALNHAEKVLEVELNSANDNPLIIDSRIVSGGHFHGQPIGAVMDYLTIVTATMSGVSERRVDHLLNPALSGLPAFLVSDPGLNSGFMIAQYTAASLVNENRTLANPASVQSIPVCGNQEDFISMATFASRKARDVVANSQVVLAIELLVAAQAVDMRIKRQSMEPDRLGVGARRLYRLVREVAPSLDSDRVLHPEVDAMTERIRDGSVNRILSPLLEEVASSEA